LHQSDGTQLSRNGLRRLLVERTTDADSEDDHDATGTTASLPAFACAILKGFRRAGASLGSMCSTALAWGSSTGGGSNSGPAADSELSSGGTGGKLLGDSVLGNGSAA
jgi:hypothetical protein